MQVKKRDGVDVGPAGPLHVDLPMTPDALEIHAHLRSESAERVRRLLSRSASRRATYTLDKMKF